MNEHELTDEKSTDKGVTYKQCKVCHKVVFTDTKVDSYFNPICLVKLTEREDLRKKLEKTKYSPKAEQKEEEKKKEKKNK